VVSWLIGQTSAEVIIDYKNGGGEVAMHLGLRLPSNGPNADAEHTLKIGQLAERLGFESLWCNDHIIMPPDTELTPVYGRLLEAFVTLAALSSVTQRVKLATGVLILPLRDPVLVAKQAAAIDAFSRGRLILGVGVGWESAEYRFLNVDFTRRGKRCDEWIDIIREVWRGAGITVSSETYQISDAVSEPVPAQPGGPPILVGGASGASLRRAAQLGDGWIPASYMSMETIVEGIKGIKAQAPPGHKGLVYVFRRPSGSFASVSAVDEMLGTLSGLQGVGVDNCVLVLPEEYPPSKVTEEIELFAEKVMPLIQ
jgi:probable F420-dependent oxidoreductase